LRHPASQVAGGITDGVKTGIPRSLAASKMGGLGDHPAAKNTNSNRVGGLFHVLSNYGEVNPKIKQPFVTFYMLFSSFLADMSLRIVNKMKA
jgi:hypothetical protein